MTWKHWALGGLAALVSSASVDAQVTRRAPVPAASASTVESPYTGPERFSLVLHQGKRPDRFDLDALETIADKIDMVRSGNTHLYPNGDERNSEYDNVVIEDDPYLERLANIMGWERVLLVIGNKNDYTGPEITDAINDDETGFIQRMVHAFPYIKFVQIYNEPCNFYDLCGGTYVPHLKAAYEWINDVENPRRVRQNERNEDKPNYIPRPKLVVISAAPFGSSDGLPEFRKDLEAGVQYYCDIIGMHDYTGAMASEYGDLRGEYGLEDKAFWMTETGYPDWEEHTTWYEKLIGMEKDLKKNYRGEEDQHIFWYS
ncbi:hypothetical protein GOV10_01675, partial [Candidatus Woesearchaeota archaeon]|nr:hypothetical protein [Candidatus Woesearchaeota archaeon]